MKSAAIELLLDLLDQAHERKSWHGPNLRGSLRGLERSELLWRPAPNRHNIWEHVVHAAYWKYTVWRRLSGAKRGAFPLDGSNWFPRGPECDARQWQADVRLLDDMHRRLRDAVSGLTTAALDRVPSGSKLSHRMVISGVAQHDVYHAGQIQLLKRLCRNDREKSR